MIVFPLSSFNRYFGNNPLQTLTKIRDESIENGNPELTKKQREELGNDLIDLYKISKKFSDKIELCRRKNKISIWKNKTSIKVEILFFYKP